MGRILTNSSCRSTVTNERPMVQFPMAVTDVTGREKEYTLDNAGFEYIHHESKTSCIADGYHDLSKIQTEYFPECEEVLKSA